ASRIGRSTFEKQYRGDLRASASGTMLTLRTPVEGSAAYVAVERVRGELDGRAGTFALQHMGTMARGAEDLTIRVVPDSGTGDLEGLEGRLDIEIVEGEHRYALEYRIPDDEARR
ncbi:MAG: DUF3224 domain-containing protein, partial [Thermoanaerobaculia bacterium]|nr:DUF3224 domain-containing protein [Thermoanaerobaculia bacterium]